MLHAATPQPLHGCRYAILSDIHHARNGEAAGLCVGGGSGIVGTNGCRVGSRE